MFGITFGHGTMRNMVVYFGRLFDNIHLNRYDANNVLTQNMKVPLGYGPKEKFLSRAQGDPDIEREIAIQLPRIAFEMSGFTYDPSRKLNSINKIVYRGGATPTAVTYQYAPVPYNIHFNLYIMVKNAEDGTYIVEQILPYFSPTWNAKIRLNPDMNQSYDMPISLDDVSAVDTYEGDYNSRRALVWTLQFTMQGWLFGPTHGGGKIINKIDLSYIVPNPGVTISDAFGVTDIDTLVMSITPGQNANAAVNWYGANTAAGRPTTVAANTIGPNEPYGFMIDFTKDVI